MPSERLAAIYARVSTEEQAKGLVTSTETQVARCREKAAALGLLVAPADSGLIVEERHSGADLRWEGTKFMALVRRAETGDFSDLIVLDLDRFCRGGSDAYGVQRGLLAEAGVRIHYVQTDLGGEHNPFRGTIEALYADAAQAERDKTRERSMRVRTAIAAAGYITPGPVPPFGFRWIEDATQRTKRDRPRKVGLEPDPVTAPALLHITEHVARGGSIEDACRWLDEQHIPTRRGAPIWHGVTVRRILHSPTNYGERRSFETRVVARPEGARRPKSLKTHSMQVPRPEEDQYPVKAEYVKRIEGLTEELWRRAVAQLAENKAFARRYLKLPLEERVQYGLLRGPMIRCAICGHAMPLNRKRDPRAPSAQPDRWRWRYECTHYSTPAQGDNIVTISAAKLDTLVWETASACVRDPDFFTRLLAESDAVNGPAVRVASLTRQLTEAASARDKLLRQLERLDADDELVAEYQAKLRANKTLRDELARDLDAAQAAASTEAARRATISRFTRYADAERERLDAYTALQRHQLLRALCTRVVVNRGDTLSRVSIVFDLRHLPADQAHAEFDWPVVEEEPSVVVTDADITIDLSETPDVAIEASGPLTDAGAADQSSKQDAINERLYPRSSGRC
jgi:DNA invertase Pin-like site-specific DNA recombinase